MRYPFLFLLFLVLLGGLRPGGARAQQVLGQQGLGTYQPAMPYSLLRTTGQLAATAPDSCLLLVSQVPGNDASDPQTRSRLVWVSSAGCDTARFASLPAGRTNYEPAALVRRRRGDLLVASTYIRQTAALTDSNHVELRSYSRGGTLRWMRSYPATSRDDQVYALVEAPDRGAYLTVSLPSVAGAVCQLYRVDSMGRLLWRRLYCKGPTQVFSYAYSNLYYHPAYTVRGNLLLGGYYSTQSQPTARGLVVEITQRGDSLTSRELRPADPTRNLNMLGLRPLHNGGFLVTATLDTTLNGSSVLLKLPYLLRLDADLNVQWRRGYKSAIGNHLLDLTQGGYELADGSLLVFYHGGTASAVLRWLHLSAAGALLATDTFQPGQPTRAGVDQWLTPLAADSSFMLAGNRLLYNGLYLTHFRLPGLRRVLAEPGIPPAQVLAARTPLAAFPAPAFPNPAREAVAVPLPPGNGAGRLRLLDLTGRLVREWPAPAGAAPVTLPLGGVAPGVYLLQFERAGQPPAVQRLAVGP